MGALDNMKRAKDSIRSSGTVSDVGKITKRISDHAKLDLEKEYERIRDRLDEGEKVAMLARQSRGIMPGKGMVTPRMIYVTEKRVIIRVPTRLGMGESIGDYYYNEITTVRLEKGLRSSAIVLHIPGMTEMSKSSMFGGISGGGHGEIGGLDKAEAEAVYQYIRERVDAAKKQKEQPTVIQQASAQLPPADPLTTLKTRLVMGEISEEEYARLKKILES